MAARYRAKTALKNIMVLVVGQRGRKCVGGRRWMTLVREQTKLVREGRKQKPFYRLGVPEFSPGGAESGFFFHGTYIQCSTGLLI